MLELQRIQDTSVGFIDPYIVFKTDIIPKGAVGIWSTEEYHEVLREAARQDNNTFPVQLWVSVNNNVVYTFYVISIQLICMYVCINQYRFHWILIVIELNSSRLVIFDSLRKERALYQDMIDIIQG